jgi:hypothetical protein
MDDYIKISIGLAVSIITAIITYFLTLRSNEAKVKIEILKEQKYKFFLPFKFACNEFMHRLIHIEERLSNPELKHIKTHFQQNFENKDINWFYTDWYNPEIENMKPGGYFLTSTIYMNCILYQKINALLKEYPFLQVKLEQNLDEIIEDEKQIELEKYYKLIINKPEKHYRIIKQLKKIKFKQKRLSVKELTLNIRTATIMKNGIPYALQDSFGDFVTKNHEIINYDDFVKLLIDKDSRIKFKLIIEFWTSLVDNTGIPNEQKLDKIRALIIFLTMIDKAIMK